MKGLTLGRILVLVSLASFIPIGLIASIVFAIGGNASHIVEAGYYLFLWWWFVFIVDTFVSVGLYFRNKYKTYESQKYKPNIDGTVERVVGGGIPWDYRKHEPLIVPGTPYVPSRQALEFTEDTRLPVIVALTDGSPVTDDHRDINPVTGQQKAYVALTEAERAKGFIRPLRDTYLHKNCGTTTKMNSQALIETYARQPTFYTSTFCMKCKDHRPVREFVWDGTDEMVGS